MKRILLFIFLLLGFTSVQAKDKDLVPEYNISCAGQGSEGYYLVKVSVISKKNKVADVDFKRAAVHGVIFRGYAAADRIPAQKPLINDISVEQTRAEYFNAFFADGGGFEQFASVVTGITERVKVGKQYRISANVQVAKSALQSELNKAGIARRLSDGF